eukprot:TRINITY_DN13184_c0_g1_i1.p1 TRINITY_DN13184_c0_g1~~TRINITY_DN13184_c0_g1_i1.p1  ORF type:complete len:207 (-),score=23.78 TRINITY_DN13184_c0_g1_i1:48-668(-)
MAPELKPATITVNGQLMYLTADRKLNVTGTFGPSTLLIDAAGTIIPCDATGKTEFTLQEGSAYTTTEQAAGPRQPPTTTAATARPPFATVRPRPAVVATPRPTVTPAPTQVGKAPSQSIARLRAAARQQRPYVSRVQRPPRSAPQVAAPAARAFPLQAFPRRPLLNPTPTLAMVRPPAAKPVRGFVPAPKPAARPPVGFRTPRSRR